MIKALIFDWGDTVMRDFPDKPGPMAQWDHVEWIPGAESAMQILSKKYPCVIATNAGLSDAGLMKQALQRVGAEKYFSYFISSKELNVEKPNPDFFQSVASGIRVQAFECVHIGNIYEKDITGAKAAGMFTVFFNEKKLNGIFPDADMIIEKMEGLPAAIMKISAGHSLESEGG